MHRKLTEHLARILTLSRAEGGILVCGRIPGQPRYPREQRSMGRQGCVLVGQKSDEEKGPLIKNFPFL